MHAFCLPLVAFAMATTPSPVGSHVADFTLRDFRGADWQLADQRGKIVVVVFLGCDCPLVKLYANRLGEMSRKYARQGVVFVGINANAHESLNDISRYVRLHALPFPILKDVGNQVADRLGAGYTPEVVLLDRDHVIRYRGRIDDQYTPTVHRAAPTRGDLLMALEELVSGKPVTVDVTEPSGCIISRVGTPVSAATVTYARDVAPILNNRCVRCHRPGQIAPFPLTSYQDASGWAETIQQVVSEGRMPPWSADPRHGRFANDPTLGAQEKKTIAEWLRQGCPKGEPRDLPPSPVFPEEWALGAPDIVLSMAEPFQVPAEGVIEYQSFEVDPGFTENTWIRAAQVLPGNRAVVHHCTVFLKPPGADDVFSQGRLGSYCLAAMALGTPPLSLPPGTAKLVPAGWRIEFVIHYTAVGSVQTDRTRLGLWLADPKTVQKEVATKLMYDPDLVIPPHAKDHEVSQTWAVQDDLLLFAMFPHMHLRGKSFRYEVVYPDQSVEILLDVPRYDFNWQHRYELAEPKRLPKGSMMRCIAIYDNSGGNPANPDPSATVRAGPQSWDEMFNGYWDVALADQDLTNHSSGTSRQLSRLVPLAAVLVLGVIAMLARRQARASA